MIKNLSNDRVDDIVSNLVNGVQNYNEYQVKMEEKRMAFEKYKLELDYLITNGVKAQDALYILKNIEKRERRINDAVEKFERAKIMNFCVTLSVGFVIGAVAGNISSKL